MFVHRELVMYDMAVVSSRIICYTVVIRNVTGLKCGVWTAAQGIMRVK